MTLQEILTTAVKKTIENFGKAVKLPLDLFKNIRRTVVNNKRLSVMFFSPVIFLFLISTGIIKAVINTTQPTITDIPIIFVFFFAIGSLITEVLAKGERVDKLYLASLSITPIVYSVLGIFTGYALDINYIDFDILQIGIIYAFMVFGTSSMIDDFFGITNIRRKR